MIMEWLKAVEWDHPAIVAATGAAVAGIFLIAAALLKRKKQPDDRANIKIENKPSNVLKQTFGLDEKDVGDEVGRAVDPLREDVASVSAEIKALSEQMTAQLAPKQPLPDSKDPLRVKAVEFFNAGVEAYENGEIGQAIGHWLDALKLDPQIAAVHFNLGVVMKEKGEFDKAIEYYNAAIRIDADYASAHNNLGSALWATGEFDTAIVHFSAASRINPESARHHNNLSKAMAKKKDAAAAVAGLAKAIELDPDYRDKAKIDADFDLIRDDPAFVALVCDD